MPDWIDAAAEEIAGSSTPAEHWNWLAWKHQVAEIIRKHRLQAALKANGVIVGPGVLEHREQE